MLAPDACGVRLLTIVFAGYAANAFSTCEAPKPAVADGLVIHDARPRLEWPAIEGATGYRFRLQSRVPEGRVIAVADTVLDRPSFLPPQPLAEQRAKVSLRVSALCGKEQSAETSSWFLIDASTNCRMKDVTVSADSIAWEPVPGAQSYEVRRYRRSDGGLIDARETRSTSMKLDNPLHSVLSVQPRCAAGSGERVYRVLMR